MFKAFEGICSEIFLTKNFTKSMFPLSLAYKELFNFIYIHVILIQKHPCHCLQSKSDCFIGLKYS